MPRIQVPELPQALRDRYKLKGAGSIDTLAPEIVPVVVVDSLVEDQRPQVRIGRAGVSQAAGAAGFLAEAGLRVGSSELLYVERAIVSLNGTVQFNLRTGAPSGTVTATNTFYRDGRRGQNVGPLGQTTVANDNAAAAGALIGAWYNLANTPVVIELGIWLSSAGGGPFPLDAGSEIHFDSGSANTGLTVVWFFQHITDPTIVP